MGNHFKNPEPYNLFFFIAKAVISIKQKCALIFQRRRK